MTYILFFVIGFLTGFIAAVYLAIHLDIRHKRSLSSTVMESLTEYRPDGTVIKHPSVRHK